jgi:hypothetical protein
MDIPDTGGADYQLTLISLLLIIPREIKILGRSGVH